MPRFLVPLVQRRTYLETADLVLDLVVGVAWFSVFTTLVATGASLLFALVGLPLLAATFYLARSAAALDRRRARVFLGTEIETPVRAPARGDGHFQRLVTPFRDRTTWKELLYVSLVQPTQSLATATQSRTLSTNDAAAHKALIVSEREVVTKQFTLLLGHRPTRDGATDEGSFAATAEAVPAGYAGSPIGVRPRDR
jgi:hypothetical protein